MDIGEFKELPGKDNENTFRNADNLAQEWDWETGRRNCIRPQAVEFLQHNRREYVNNKA